jgi:hypothetical protein
MRILIINGYSKTPAGNEAFSRYQEAIKEVYFSFYIFRFSNLWVKKNLTLKLSFLSEMSRIYKIFFMKGIQASLQESPPDNLIL